MAPAGAVGLAGVDGGRPGLGLVVDGADGLVVLGCGVGNVGSVGPVPGVATVVFHSIVYEYFPEPVREAFHRALDEAGARASAEAPLAWLRFEATPATRGYGTTLTTWPGAEERVVATAGAPIAFNDLTLRLAAASGSPASSRTRSSVWSTSP